ncbi:restriction endonuclease subunit S [Microtetraspora malaysiensis]|uniref:restriction endonuclease subunit S n=1 Tax=Microtetraspora malaysiensis TaxID=161358 RepID=UPI003D8B419C
MTDAVRLKWLLSESDVRAGAAAEKLPLLSVSISWGVRRREASDTTTRAASEDLSNYKVCRAGNLVINRMRAFQGALGIAGEDGIVSPDYAVLQVAPEVDARWLNYFLTSEATVATMSSLVRGIGGTEAGNVRTPRLNISDLLSMTAPLGSVTQQRAIADYLDRETARIDTLIEEQQRLIEMLRERRQAVVHRAVGGLDHIACRPTNDPWWPKLPEGWAPLRLRRVIRGLADGPHFSPNYVDEGVMFLSARNIRVDGWSLDDAKFVSEEDYLEFSKRVVPEPGDVLYTKGGTTGIARVVDLDFPFQVWVHVAVLKVRQDLVDSAFLAYALNSPPCYDQSQLFTRGATNNDLGLTRMVNIVLPVPPLEQQRQIIADLDQQTAKIDTLITESRRFIELARERRSALITAAVTGQIDVREAA